jgi:hypothetical protein
MPVFIHLHSYPLTRSHPLAFGQVWERMRSHSLVADFGGIVRRREPDIPVKDGALSQPFFSLPQALAQKSAGGKMKNGCRKALTRVQMHFVLAHKNSPARSADDPDGSVFFLLFIQWYLVIE